MSKRPPREKEENLKEEQTESVNTSDGDADPAPPAVGSEDEADELRAALEDLNGKWLRALADLDNYKKRVERDRRRWSEASREEVLLDLLDVADNLERALAANVGADADGNEPLREGVELILKHLVDVLRRHGVVAIETAACVFDPNLHEAVGQVESDDHDSNQIVEETQKGYMLGDRLLRCSRVVVAR